MKIGSVSLALVLTACVLKPAFADELVIPCTNGCSPASSCPTGTTQEGDCSNSCPAACGTCTGTVKCYDSMGVLKKTIRCTGNCPKKISPAAELPPIPEGPLCRVRPTEPVEDVVVVVPSTVPGAGATPSSSGCGSSSR